MDISKIPEKGFLSTNRDELALEICDYLSGNTNPKNFVGLCDEDWIFIKPSVDHTITVDGGCKLSGGLTIQAVISRTSKNATILCTSYRANGGCKIPNTEGKCPFHKDKDVSIQNPVKGIVD